MLTKINLVSISSSTPVLVGQRVEDTTTGAHGIVAEVDYSNNFIKLHDVVGTFADGNQICNWWWKLFRFCNRH